MPRRIEYRLGDRVLTYDDVARIVLLRKSANLTLDAIAVAVCFAESSGHTKVWAQVDNPASPAHLSWDRGLWQINSFWHPEVSDAQCDDPNGACDAVYRISMGFMVWSPWSAYNSGAYIFHMPAATEAVVRHARPDWWNDWIKATKGSIRPCARGWDVAYVQDVLRVRAGQAVSTTGFYDSALLHAVHNLQAFIKVPQTGVIGGAEWSWIDYLASA